MNTTDPDGFVIDSLRSRLKECESVSEGRRRTLVAKAEELRREWARAEQAEAKLARITEAVRAAGVKFFDGQPYEDKALDYVLESFRHLPEAEREWHKAEDGKEKVEAKLAEALGLLSDYGKIDTAALWAAGVFLPPQYQERINKEYHKLDEWDTKRVEALAASAPTATVYPNGNAIDKIIVEVVE